MFQQSHKQGEGINLPLSAHGALGLSKLGKELKKTKGLFLSWAESRAGARRGRLSPGPAGGNWEPHPAPLPAPGPASARGHPPRHHQGW